MPMPKCGKRIPTALSDFEIPDISDLKFEISGLKFDDLKVVRAEPLKLNPVISE